MAETSLVQHFFTGHLLGASCALGEPRELANCGPLAHRAGGLVTTGNNGTRVSALLDWTGTLDPQGAWGRGAGLGMQRMSGLWDG